MNIPMARLRLIFLVVAATIFVVFAQDAQEPPTLATAFRVGVGEHLIDDRGMSLYGFTQESGGEIACTESCLDTWPPFTTTMEPTAESGVNPALVETIRREDGSTQVTYNGWPLYFYSGDTERGAIEGHRVSDSWFLVARDGSLLGAEGVQPPGSGDESSGDQQSDGGEASAVSADVMALGESVYTSVASPPCVSCHGANGEGGVGAVLAGFSRLQNGDRLIATILRGGHIMPSFGSQLSDEQVAAVATFVRNSWGNDFGLVTPEEVSSVR